MKAEGRRRSDRIWTLVPIRVSGVDRAGNPFEEETQTVNVNKHGGCISLSYSLSPGNIVTIKNLRNGIEGEFRVVGSVRQVFGSRQEFGVEVVDPEIGIWGLDFTPPPEVNQPRAVIRCTSCDKEVLTDVSLDQYQVLLATGLVSRHCDRCGEATRWKPSEQTLTGHAVEPDTHAASAMAERRKHRRRKLAMRLNVRRHSDGSEMVQTMDVSKSGFCFASKQSYKVRDVIYVTLPQAENETPSETKGRIMWEHRVPVGKLYGVMYVK
jgi:hypothetical protein